MSELEETPAFVQQLIPVVAGIGMFVAMTVVGVFVIEQPLVGATAGLFIGFGGYHTMSYVFSLNTSTDPTGTQPDPKMAAAATALEPVGILLFAMSFITDTLTQTILYTAAASVVVVPVAYFFVRWMFREMAATAE